MANPEHLKILRQGVDAWNKWRKENPETIPDLEKADLGGLDLHGANLGFANLIKADLRGANLFKVHLAWADLRWADLRGASLRVTQLDGALFYRANLGGADLRAGSHGQRFPDRGFFLDDEGIAGRNS